MAKLSAKIGRGVLQVNYARGTSNDRRQPPRVQLSIVGTDHLANAPTLDLTEDDFRLLRAAIRNVGHAEEETVSITSAREDFVFEARRLQSSGDVAIGVWFGAPGVVMNGFYFVVTERDLGLFLTALETDGFHVAT